MLLTTSLDIHEVDARAASPEYLQVRLGAVDLTITGEDADILIAQLQRARTEQKALSPEPKVLEETS